MQRRTFLQLTALSGLSSAWFSRSGAANTADFASDLARDESSWIFTENGLRFRLSCTAPDVWRLQSAAPGADFDPDGAVQQTARALGDPIPAGHEALNISRRKGFWRAQRRGANSGESRIEVRTSPFQITLVSARGERLCALDGFSQGERVRVGGPLHAGEAIWGLGERFNQLNQRGKSVNIWAEDRWTQREGNSYLPLPWMLSSRRYGLLLNRFEFSRFDIGKADPNRFEIELEDAPLDLYLLGAASPRGLLFRLGELCGFAPSVPDWAFGVWVSRHGFTKELTSLEGVRKMRAEMDLHDLPWTATVIEGFPTYNAGRRAELKTLCDELHAAGKKVLVYDQAGHSAGERFADWNAQPQYFARDAAGDAAISGSEGDNPADAPGKTKRRFLDVSNPDAVAWWKREVWGPLLNETGVDGAKIDFCEQFPADKSLQIHDKSLLPAMHHLHPVVYNALMLREMNARRPEGAVVWSRGGGIGASRYPMVWVGDQLREFRFLETMLLGTLSAGLSGVPLVGHDLAGYRPAAPEKLADNPEAEVFVRGAQLACFGPNMQTHGVVTRPYDFAPPVVDAYRTYCRIHYALVPYLSEQTRAGNAVGMPLMRHLWLHFPDDPTTQSIENQFLLGEDLLVAPVLTRARKRDIYLPPGAWRELASGREFRGGQWLRDFAAPTSQTPVFVSLAPTSRALPGVLAQLAPLWRGLSDAALEAAMIHSVPSSPLCFRFA